MSRLLPWPKLVIGVLLASPLTKGVAASDAKSAVFQETKLALLFRAESPL